MEERNEKKKLKRLSSQWPLPSNRLQVHQCMDACVEVGRDVSTAWKKKKTLRKFSQKKGEKITKKISPLKRKDDDDDDDGVNQRGTSNVKK